MPKAIGRQQPGKGFSPATAAGTRYDGDIRFTVQVTNQSDRSVKEPVLLFVSDLVASLTPDVKRLRAFTKVELAPHETKTVTLTVRPSDLAYVNEDLQWILEPGKFRATIGNQQVEFGI
jgi:beta-glucosidase